MAARLGLPEVGSGSACSSAELVLLVEDLMFGGLRVGGGEMSRSRELGNTIICAYAHGSSCDTDHSLKTIHASCDVLWNVSYVYVPSYTADHSTVL